MNRRRKLLLALGSVAFASPLVLHAQVKIGRIGYLSPYLSAKDQRFEAFKQQLRDLGHVEGEAATTEYDREFFLLKVQVLIFYYDVMLGMVTLARNRSSGFARCVAIKSLAHNVYEYDKQLSGTLIPRIIRAGLSDISYGNSYRTSSSRAKRMIYTSLNRSFVPAKNLSD